MERDRRLELRLSPHDLDVLDSRRGEVTRAAWLRAAIHDLPAVPVVAPISATPAPTQAQVMPSMTISNSRIAPDPSLCKAGNRWVRMNGTYEEIDGRATYECRCGCGERRAV